MPLGFIVSIICVSIATVYIVVYNTSQDDFSVEAEKVNCKRM